VDRPILGSCLVAQPIDRGGAAAAVIGPGRQGARVIERSNEPPKDKTLMDRRSQGAWSLPSLSEPPCNLALCF
jgi:hypothetical protein